MWRLRAMVRAGTANRRDLTALDVFEHHERPMTRNPNLDLPPSLSVAPRGGRDALPDGESWWTGKPPRGCPGVRADGVLSSLPPPDTARCSRQGLIDYFDNGWTLTELLFSALRTGEAFFRPPYHALRHPLIFYYGHPAAVFVNKLRVAGLLDAPVDPYLEQIFETGVDEMSWDDLARDDLPWPSIREVHAYRARVHTTVLRLLGDHPALGPGHPPILRGDPLWAILMGCEHERIHLETSSVLIRELPADLVRRPPEWPPLHPSARRFVGGSERGAPGPGRDEPRAELIPVAAGTVTIGKPAAWPSFGWDNEYGARVAPVRAFAAGRRLVRNHELFEFVRAGGYAERRFWTDEGWRWRSFRNAKWPTFWVPVGPAGLHRYALRTCFELVEMPWDWPAIVNYHEARAYCAFRTERDRPPAPYRPITEAEHHRLRDPGVRGNIDLSFGSEGPVEAFAPTRAGFHDVFGNVWEWCEDHFHPLPGFAVDPLYDDFSAPCFDGEHQMILGGSFVSTGDEASAYARFHFRPHFFQHAGFRLVRSDDGDPTCDAVRLGGPAAATDPYETRRLLGEYMTLHFGADADAMPYADGPVAALGFPIRCARLVLAAARELGVRTGRALDVGCAVGRAAFELARGFEAVVGVDLSALFIEAAQALRRDGSLEYFLKEEGELGATRRAAVEPEIDRSRVSFLRADACALPLDRVGFDAVLVANVLCRLPRPAALLARMGGPRGLVRPGGLLVLSSPYTWLEEFTPRDAWLGGFERDGAPVRSSDGVRALLGEEFELMRELNMPLVIREHARKYQYIVAHGMVFRRRGEDV